MYILIQLLSYTGKQLINLLLISLLNIISLYYEHNLVISQAMAMITQLQHASPIKASILWC